MIHGYLYGIGAMIAKHLKCGNWGILHYVAHLMWRWAVAGAAVDLGHRPSRWLRLRAFVLGAKAGLAHAVERRRSLYRGAQDAEDRMGAVAADCVASRGGSAEPECAERKLRSHDD
jgi:hypothetical protein